MQRALDLVVILAVVVLLPWQAAAEQWTMARHDPQRTAYAQGASDIVTPAVRWRYFLGSSLESGSYVTWPVDDGLEDVVVVSGARVSAYRSNGRPLWDTPDVAYQFLDGFADFDGDGEVEVVARGVWGQVALVRLSDGIVVWEIPPDVIGTASGTRIADLDNDDLPDLYIAECRCCAFNSGEVGAAYSFRNGFEPSEVVELWRLPGLFSGYGGGCNGQGDAIGDVDGDGDLEVAVMGISTIAVVDGATGSTLWRFDPSAGPFDPGVFEGGKSLSVVIDVDDDGSEEIVLFGDFYRESSNTGRRWVALFDLDEEAGTIVLRWAREVADPRAALHRFDGRSVSDLDGDGDLEIVTSFYDDTVEQWGTFVIDADDGFERDAVAGSELVGVADIDGDNIPEILGRNDETLRCFVFDGSNLIEQWTLEGFTTLKVTDRTRMNRQGLFTEMATLDVDGDAINELIVQSPEEDRASPHRIAVYDVEGESPQELAVFEAPSGVRLGAFGFSSGLSQPQRQLLAVRSDGYLVAFDHELRQTNFSDDPDRPISSLQVGGYYSGGAGLAQTAVVAQVDRPDDVAVVVRTSRKSLVRIDPRGATVVVSPTVVWERQVGWFPTAVDVTADGTPEIVHWTETSGGLDTVSAVDIDDGEPLWARVIAHPLSSAHNDLPHGDVNDDGVDDLFVTTRSESLVETANVLDGLTGGVLWTGDFEQTLLSRQTFGKSVIDANGDGAADLVGVFDFPYILSGVDGSILASGPDNLRYLFGMIADITDDPGSEIYLHGGILESRLLRGTDLDEIWLGTDQRRTNAFAALAPCEDGTIVVGGRLNAAELLATDAATGVTSGSAWLAGGRQFASEDVMSASGEIWGVLSSITAMEDLTGAGDIAALIGSTDGYLYAMNPCSMILLWSMDLGAPVGAPVVADTDGDGVNDILVSVADGYLYNIVNQIIAAPEYVWDTDPPHGFTGEDRDTIETVDTLYAVWGGVADATSYEVAVIGPGNVFLTTPAFIDVGSETSVESSALPLQVGEVYRFAVRAVGTLGTSAETISDGIEVVEVGGPADADADVDADGDPGDADIVASGTTYSARGGFCDCQTAGQSDVGVIQSLAGVLSF